MSMLAARKPKKWIQRSSEASGSLDALRPQASGRFETWSRQSMMPSHRTRIPVVVACSVTASSNTKFEVLMHVPISPEKKLDSLRDQIMQVRAGLSDVSGMSVLRFREYTGGRARMLPSVWRGYYGGD